MPQHLQVFLECSMHLMELSLTLFCVFISDLVANVHIL